MPALTMWMEASPTPGATPMSIMTAAAGDNAWIIETGLMPGTYYDFGVHPDPKFSGGSSGTGTYTLGPRLIIEVEDIEQTEATVNVALPTDEFEDMGERTIHLAYYETADELDPNLRNIQVKPTPQVTVKGSTSFGLDNLSAGTKYKVKASLASAFPTHHTEVKTFTTKLGKPTDLEVEPGDRQLEVSWKAPDGDGVGITGYEVEYREDGEQSWSTSSASVEESTDPDTEITTYTSIISSLDVSTLYDVRVRAVNSIIEDDKDDYNWAERNGTTLPDLPASLEVTPGIKQLTLAWEEPAETGTVDITRYVVQYKKTSDTSWTSHTTVAAVSGATTYGTTIPNLDISTEYDVRVRADNGVALQDDDDFNWTEGNGTTLPGVPASLEVTPGIKQLTLSWDEPAETGTVAITGYVVEYKEEAAPVWDTLPTVAAVSGTTTYETIIISLTDNTKYEVRVRADNGVTLQEQDNYNWADDTGTTLPGAPENLEVTPGNEKLTLRWEEPAETGNVNITGYKVQYKDSSVADWDSPTGVTEVSVSGLTREITSLTNNTTYDVRVRADNGVTSDNYNWVTGSDTPVPNPRIGIITVKTKSQIGATLTVTIEDFDFDKEQTVHLRHRVKSPPGTWQYATPQITGAGSVDFDLVSLSGNTVYEVEAWLVADTNDIAEYELTTSSVVPDPPTITDIEHGDRNLTVTWTKPDDGGSQITGYKVQWTVKGQNSWTSKTVSDPNALEGSTDPVLTNGTEYTVQVIAFNSVGDSQPSNHMHETPSRKPYAPTIQSVTPGPKQLVVTWSEPANGGDPITNYKVEYKEQVAPSWTLHKEVDQNTFTETIGSLTNGTTYAVQVSAKNINGYGDPSPERTDTPRPEPAVSGVSVDEIEQTTAVATVNISDPTGEQKMVHLRFRVNSSSEARTTPTPQSTTTNSVAFPQFTGLKSDTEYRVEASFDSTFNSGVQFKLFTTKRPTVSSVEIDDNTITQAGATATVTIQEPNGKQQTVRLRYRPSTQDDWSTTATDAGEIPVNTSTDAAAVPISDLKSGTLYEVEASLESDYSQSATTTFTTEGPSLTGITISEVMQQSAKATIGIEAPNGQSLAIFVRHRKVTNPVNEVWTRADTSSTSATADAPLSNLTSGTEYEVQASLVRVFPDEKTISETFTTHDPSLSGLTVMSVTLTGATLKVDIQAHNDESQTINYRYRPVTQNDWTTTATDAGSDSTTSTTGNAEFTLASLTSGIQYQVQASLDSDLDNPILPVLEAKFTTLTPDPSISDVAIDAKQTMAKATITIANPGASGNTVHLHFRVQNTNTWSSPALTSATNTSEATIDMTSLTERTTYEVEVALNSGFTSSTTVTFTTLVTPTITSVSVDDITKTTATATVAIANPDGTDRTVHLQYRINDATPADTWTKVMEDSDTGSQEFGLSSLSPGTTYEVEASFDSNFGTGVEDTEFTTTYAPSISSVSVGSITKTTATATVSIANPDDTSRTVHLQYRKHNQSPEAEWTKPTPKDTSAGSETFDLTSLTPGMTYEVQASFDSGFSPHKDTTFTTVFEPSISAVGVGDIEKTTATATVVIANPDGTNKTVNLQYREYNKVPEAEWTKPTPKDTATGSETFDLTSLIPGTTYAVQASFDSNFDTYKGTTFTTKFAPTISAVRVDPDSITKTTASVIVIIANPDGTDQTVQLQYRIRDPQGNWSATQTEDTRTGTATINLTGLIAGTTYEVEVSLASGFGSTQTATFTTKYEPSISSVSMGSVTQTTATAAISIDNADDSIQTVHLQYREKDATPPAGWTSATPETSTTSAASIDISGLTADKTYEVEAWLANDTAKKVTATFTTLEDPNGTPTPSVSSVGVSNIMMKTATATVNIANPGTAQNTVNLRYSVKDENDWTDKDKSDTGSTVAIDLSSLTAGTTYEVEAWLSTDTSKKVTATFTTSPAPSISSISVGSITRTSASATVNIANPGTAQNTVNLRYSVDGEDSWADHTKSETGSTVSFPLSGLTAGTTYEVEAWLGSDMDNKATATFTTTLPAAVLSPTINSVRVGNILETTATATVNIDNADGSTQTAKLQYRATNPQGNWSSTYENTSTTGTTTINFGGMTAGTRYQVQAWLASDASDKVTASFQTQQAAPNNPPPQRSPVNPTPPVTELPEVASVSVTNETQTTADATVKIDNAGTAQNTVNLRYSVDGEDSWTDHTKTEAGSAVEFPLSSLTAGTAYEVEAWLGSDTDNKVTATFTTSMAPSISSIGVGGITKTSATATVNIANPGDAQNTVNLHYSVDGEDSWTDHTKTEAGSAVEFPLSSLTAGTAYEVEAWLGSDTDNKVTATFTTSMAPSISSIGVGGITKTSATATVNIANPGDAQNTVNLRYSVDGENSWTDHTKTETGSAVEFPLSSLTAGTTYEVEAWLGSDTDNKVTETFTTSMAPSISSIGVGGITKTSATATVNIANPGDAQNTVNLRYSIDGEDSWTDHTKTEAGSTVEFPLSSLTADTAYEVEAWLGSDTDNKVTATFTTSMAPSISSIGVSGITKTSATATVNIANPGDAQNTVNLRYSVDGEDSWTDHTKTETGSTVRFPLSGLTAGTTYEVEAWLGSDTDNKVIATFMTIQAAAETPPSISSVRVLNVTRTSARVVVGLANANAGQRVYLQHKLSSAQWPTTSQDTTHTNGIATFILSSLTTGTEYHTRVSLNSDMSDATTRSFTTSPPPPPQRSPEVPTPSVSSVTFNNETQTSADATVDIADAGTAKKTVRLHYRIEDTTAWSTPPKSENTSGSSKTFALTSLTAGTTYEVQAWLNTSRPPSGTQIYRFDTLDEVVPVPAISNLKCENIGQTYATAMVEFANAGTEMKEVFLKHSIQGGDEWTMLPFPTITYDDDTSIPLTGLTEGTTYEVVVALSEDFSGMIIEQCTTLAAPSLSGISVGSITHTNAIATVTIADAGSAQNTVHLRYREFGETKWNTARTKTTTGASAAFNLTGLDPRTTYEVQTSLDIEFSASKYAIFTTLSPDPSVSGVSVGSITQTSATATVTIAYPGIARKTVHLRYRVSGETEWGAAQTKATSGGSAAIDLTGLSPRTMYEVEASLSGDFAGSKTATFSTLSLDPSVSGVSIGSITQASAAATVTIANPGTAQKIVYLQYRVDGTSEWSDSALTATTDGPNATIYMTGLIADTEYEVRASLASDFALAQHATFTTLRYPSIYDVDVTDITKTTATAETFIADPDGSSQTVHLRHRTTTPQGEWSSTFTTASTTREASIDLTGLTVDTEYEVEASLTSDFAVAVSDTFRTLPPDPVVAEVSVHNIRQTSATAAIDIANSNGSSQPVSLRYRNTTPRGNWSNIQTTTSTTDSASIDLSGLTPGTEYDVQASLDDSFPATRTKSATFTTLRGPSIASFEAENIGRNGATVSAMIADSHGVAQTVYVRHRDVRYNAWKPTQQTDSVDDVASIRLRGLSSGTEYIAEASLDNSFPDGGTRSVTFTTKKREDDDDGSSSVGGNVAQAARAANVPLLGFSPQMLRFTAIEGGDNPPPQTFLAWNRAQGSMSFTLSNQQEWLSQQPTSGVSNGPDDQVTITASVDSSALASGQYVDIINIDVSSSGKSPAQVIVVLDVLPPDYIRQFVSRDEGGVVVLPDGTVKIVVQPLAPPKDVDIELMKVNLQAHGQPPGEQERVVVAIESNTYPPGGDTPEDVAYAPYVELWVQPPQEDAAACDEGKTRVYSVEAETWSLVEHRCETDESDKVWAVAEVERLGQFALVIDDAAVAATPTPVAAAVAAMPTAMPATAPAVAVQRLSLPAQPPTPVPTSVPTAVPMPNGKTTVAPAMAPTPTPTAVPAGNEPSAPMMQASAGDGGSGGFGRIILAALGVPILIGTLIVVYLLYRERRRRDDARMI